MMAKRKKADSVEVLEIPKITIDVPIANAVIRSSMVVATTKLTIEQRAGVYALLEGLRKTNQVLASGQPVNCLNTSVKWLLEQLPVKVVAEGDQRISKVSHE